MANFDFRCEDGHTSEENHPIKDEIHVITCHECGKDATRIISSRPFIFKCGGFYRTDYERQYNTTAGSED